MALGLRSLSWLRRGLPWPFLVSTALAASLAEPPPREITFTVFSANPIAGLYFHPSDEAPAERLRFYPTARSPRYRYRGPPRLRFFELAPASAAEATVADVVLPESTAHVLLLFTSVVSPGTAARKYQVVCLDDSALQRRPETFSILNLSGLELRGTIGKRAVVLEQGMNAPVRIADATTVDLRTPFRNRLYPAFAETLELNAGERGLLILFPPFRAGSLEVQSRLLQDTAPDAADQR